MFYRRTQTALCSYLGAKRNDAFAIPNAKANELGEKVLMSKAN